MALITTEFGEPILNLPRILQYVSDDVACVNVRLSIQTAASVEVFQFINDPEVGTGDTFRFEVNKPISNLLVNDFPELITYATALSGSKFLDSVLYVFVATELDVNGDVLGASNVLQQTHYPYNFFRGQLLSEFNPNDTGSINTKFLTNAPNLRKIKRGDFVWLYGNDSSYTAGATKQEWVVQELDVNDDVLTTVATDYINPTQIGTTKKGGTGIPVEMNTDTAVKAVIVFVRDKLTPFTVRSEIKRYNVFVSCNEYRLFFLNQYNTVENVYLTGNKQRQIENSKLTFEQIEPVNAAYNQGGIKSYENRFNYSYTLNTGRLNPAEIQYIGEVLYSRKTALLVDGELIEVILTDSSLRDFDQKDSIDNITFNFIEVRSNKFR